MKKREIAKSAVVVTAARPVRAPSRIPVADSMYAPLRMCDSERPVHLLGVFLDRRLHLEGGIRTAHRMVLVRKRGTEQSHDAVVHHLVDGGLVGVDSVHHVAEDGVEQSPTSGRLGFRSRPTQPRRSSPGARRSRLVCPRGDAPNRDSGPTAPASRNVRPIGLCSPSGERRERHGAFARVRGHRDPAAAPDAHLREPPRVPGPCYDPGRVQFVRDARITVNACRSAPRACLVCPDS